MDLTCIPDPVIYAPHLGRLPQGCVDAREVLEQAIRHRQPIEIYRDRDFMHLFHVLDRQPYRHQYRLVRTRVGEDRWHVMLISEPGPSRSN